MYIISILILKYLTFILTIINTSFYFTLKKKKIKAKYNFDHFKICGGRIVRWFKSIFQNRFERRFVKQAVLFTSVKQHFSNGTVN